MPLVNPDASVYYAGAEAFSRSRTYSGVSSPVLPFQLDHPALIHDLTLIRNPRPFRMGITPSGPLRSESINTAAPGECPMTRNLWLLVHVGS